MDKYVTLKKIKLLKSKYRGKTLKVVGEQEGGLIALDSKGAKISIWNSCIAKVEEK